MKHETGGITHSFDAVGSDTSVLFILLKRLCLEDFKSRLVDLILGDSRRFYLAQ
jgi:hypothetical protein